MSNLLARAVNAPPNFLDADPDAWLRLRREINSPRVKSVSDLSPRSRALLIDAAMELAAVDARLHDLEEGE